MAVNDLYDATPCSFWTADALNDAFVSGLPGLVSLAVHPQWSNSLQLCTRFKLPSRTAVV